MGIIYFDTLQADASTLYFDNLYVDNSLDVALSATYNISASVQGVDSIFLAYEAPQIYQVSASASYELETAFTGTTVDAFLTVQTVWAISQAGVTDYSGSTTAQLSAVASGEILVGTDVSVGANITVSVNTSILIYYGYTASTVLCGITASSDWSLDITQSEVNKSFNNSYYLSASVTPVLTIETGDSGGDARWRGKLVWRRRRKGYGFVVTSV